MARRELVYFELCLLVFCCISADSFICTTAFSSEKLYNFTIGGDSNFSLPNCVYVQNAEWNTAKCMERIYWRIQQDMLLVFAHIILTFNNYYLNKRLLQKISGICPNGGESVIHLVTQYVRCSTERERE